MHETWIPGETFLHRWDARCKLGATACLCLTPTAMSDRVPLAVLAVAALGLLLWFHLPWRKLFRYLSEIHLFLIPCFLILPFSTPGDPLFHIGPFAGSLEGFKFALTLYLRAVIIATFAMGAILTTPIDVLVQAAERLYVPRVLAQICLLTYRFLFAFRADLQRIRIALRTRGFREAAGMHTYRTLAHTTGSLLIRALDRTERVTRAMRCRGYHGTLPTMRSFKLNNQDLAATGICVVFSCFFLFWEFWF